MYQKYNGTACRETLRAIIKKIGQPILIMIGRKARISWFRGLHVRPLFSPFKRKAYDGSGMTPR
jgi:hypothetical protein